MKDSTAIIVALIGVVVPATGAYLAFYDKRHPVDGPAAIANVARTPPDTREDTTPPATGKADATEPANTASAAPAGKSEPPPVQQPEATPPPAVPRIAGRWQDRDGYRFDFSQSGAEFSYRATQNGADRGSGNGTLSGNRLRYAYGSPDGPGACEATLSDDGNRITGTCHSNDTPGNSWAFTIERFIRLRIEAVPYLATIMKHRSP